MDRGAWQAAVCAVTKSQTQLEKLTLSFTSPLDISSMSAWTLFSQTHKAAPRK